MAVIFPSYMSPSLFPFNRMSSGGERSEVAVGFGTSACLLVCLFLRQSTCLQLYGACEPRTPRRWVVCVCVCVCVCGLLSPSPTHSSSSSSSSCSSTSHTSVSCHSLMDAPGPTIAHKRFLLLSLCSPNRQGQIRSGVVHLSHLR